MTKRPLRESAVLHRAPFRLDLSVARASMAATQVIIAQVLRGAAEPPEAHSAKRRAPGRANKKASA